jgi:hypothetical protein
MRRLARHLFTLCSAVSLLLCVGVCALWVTRDLRHGSVWWIDGRHVIEATDVGLDFTVESEVRSGGPKSPVNWRGWSARGFGSWRLYFASGWEDTYSVPYWFLAVATTILPSATTVRWRRRRTLRNRRLRGQCRRCGYDLRASPERCPECGTAAN